MPEREEEEETQKAKEEKHPSLDHEAQKHHNKNVTVILDLEESTSTSSSKTSSSSPSNSESSFPFTPQDQKRIIRQIDLRVVLLLGAMYAVSLIDRSQIGLAMISGMGTDLQLTVGARYNIINAVFFGPYVLFQLPSTVLLRKIGPKRFLSGATLAWGLATLACGFVREWRDLVALRVVLGACEAGFYPGGFLFLFSFYFFSFFLGCIGYTSIIQRERRRQEKEKERKKRKEIICFSFFLFYATHSYYLPTTSFLSSLLQSSTELITTPSLSPPPNSQHLPPLHLVHALRTPKTLRRPAHPRRHPRRVFRYSRLWNLAPRRSWDCRRWTFLVGKFAKKESSGSQCIFFSYVWTGFGGLEMDFYFIWNYDVCDCWCGVVFVGGFSGEDCFWSGDDDDDDGGSC